MGRESSPFGLDEDFIEDPADPEKSIDKKMLKIKLKTCSYHFVRYFRTLFWDDITIIWNENIVYFFN